jgi:AraC-like DNA-binding protein
VRDYTLAADQLIVCLEGSIHWHLRGGGVETFRTVLLRAGTPIRLRDLDTSGAITAVCFLDPIGPDYTALKQHMRRSYGRVSLHHCDEEHLIDSLRQLRDSAPPIDEALQTLDSLILPPTLDREALPLCDPRIARVIAQIKASVRTNLAVSELAKRVHLSESRLVKLFKQEIGIPITRYRIRYRVAVGVVYLAQGYSVTEAALAAGFANTAHFSRCFTGLIGIQPSTAFLNAAPLRVAIAEEVLTAVMPQGGAHHWQHQGQRSVAKTTPQRGLLMQA